MLTVTVDKIDGTDITNDIRLIDPAMIVGGSIRPITANTAGSACIMEVLTWDGNIQNYRAVRWTLTDTFTTILRALDYTQVTLVTVDGETVTTDLRAIDQSMIVAGSIRPKTANNTATAAIFKVLKWDNNTFTRIAEEWEVSETYAALKTAFITESATIPYGSTSGTDTYTVTASPALTEYIAGATVRFKVGNQNTGASTLNVNGLGAKSLVKGVSTALVAADLLAGGVYTAVYDGTNFQVKEVSTSTGDPFTSLTVTMTQAQLAICGATPIVLLAGGGVGTYREWFATIEKPGASSITAGTADYWFIGDSSYNGLYIDKGTFSDASTRIVGASSFNTTQTVAATEAFAYSYAANGDIVFTSLNGNNPGAAVGDFKVKLRYRTITHG